MLGNGRRKDHFLDAIDLELLGIHLDDDEHDDEDDVSLVTEEPVRIPAALAPASVGGGDDDDDVMKTMCRVMPWLDGGDGSGVEVRASGESAKQLHRLQPRRPRDKHNLKKGKSKKSVSFVADNFGANF